MLPLAGDHVLTHECGGYELLRAAVEHVHEPGLASLHRHVGQTNAEGEE